MLLAASEDRQERGVAPDPRKARTVDEFVACLVATRTWAGAPSVRTLAKRATDLRQRRVRSVSGEVPRPVIHSTVHHLFRKVVGRTQLDHDLVFDLLTVMAVPPEQMAWWREAWMTVFADPNRAEATIDKRFPDAAETFVGRSEELEHVVSLISPMPGGTGATTGETVVVAIDGMAGVGKTQLAIHVVHELMRRGVPLDGRIYVNLHGFDPEGRQPADPTAVMEALIRHLGWSGRMPAGRDARIRLCGSLLSRKSAVVVLDNAADEHQVRDLLSGLSATLAIVTSRHRMATLPGAVTIALDVLTDEEAVDLLGRALGAGTADVDQDVLRATAQLCGNLPLALAVTAAHLRSHPELSLADYAEHRAELGLHDEVEASLASSYDGLDATRQEVFRWLGLHPGSELEPYACAALAGVAPATIRHDLTALADHRLLERHSPPDHYRFHDLVRAYARDRTRRDDPPRLRRNALHRLLDFYRYSTAVSMDLVAPYERHRRPKIDTPAAHLPAIDDADGALAWLNAQRTNLVAAIARATSEGFHRHAVDVAQLLFRYFVTGGHHTDAFVAHQCAVRSARELHDRPAEAGALLNLGVTLWLRGRPEDAVHHLGQAIDAFSAIGDRINAARARNNLGLVHQGRGRLSEARDEHQLALNEFRAVSDDLGVAAALSNLAIVYWTWGRYPDARRYFEQEVTICTRLGDHDGVAIGLGNLGNVYKRLGDYDRALSLHQRAMELHRSTGDRAGQASTLTNLGSAYSRLGRFAKALEHHRAAHELFIDLGDENRIAETHAEIVINLQLLGQSEAAERSLHEALARYSPADNDFPPGVLNRFGDALVQIGADELATAWYELAHARAAASGDRYEEARATSGLAQILASVGRIDEARCEWHKALTKYRALRVPEADQVAARLAEPGHNT